jgi:chromosome segregation ATPase
MPARTAPNETNAPSRSPQAQYEQLYVTHNLLQAEHDRLKAEHSALGDDFHRVTTELAAIRAALGSIAPEEVERLKAEHQTALTEAERLRTALAEQNDAHGHERDRLRSEVEALRRSLDIAEMSHREEVGRLNDQLAARDQPERQIQEPDDVRVQLAELSQRLEQSESLNREMDAVLGGMGIRFRPLRV